MSSLPIGPTDHLRSVGLCMDGCVKKSTTINKLGTSSMLLRRDSPPCGIQTLRWPLQRYPARALEPESGVMNHDDPADGSTLPAPIARALADLNGSLGSSSLSKRRLPSSPASCWYSLYWRSARVFLPGELG